MYAKRSLKSGDQLERDDVYFAMPLQGGQLDSGKFRGGIVIESEIEPDQPIMESSRAYLS